MSVTSGHRRLATVGVHEDPLRICVSKKDRTKGFDCFAPRFPQELPSGCLIRAVVPLFPEHGCEMFDCTILE
jgi:hypothetical protein